MSTFQTNPDPLRKLLNDCTEGKLKLPEFQRSWVWDEDRVKSLIASVSRAFPIGALMSLETGGPANFHHRSIEGAPEAADDTRTERLLLDGQQRITSLYQACFRDAPVYTTTVRNKRVQRWFYIDIRKSLDADVSRESAIVGVPESRVLKSGKSVVLDLSSPDREYAQCMFPFRHVFDYKAWEWGFHDHWNRSHEQMLLFLDFERKVLENFSHYSVPVITLDKDTPIEAVCLVFEKVNTGGKSLDTFELLTAMYAADRFNLRDDWFGSHGTEGRQRSRRTEGRRQRLREFNTLRRVSGVDFLQVVSLLHTKDQWTRRKADGIKGRDLPAVTATRLSLLRLPLSAYRQYAGSAEEGLGNAAKFLHSLNIFDVKELPYPSQLVPLAAIIAELGAQWEDAAIRTRLMRWFWSGVFGEQYGSATETRFARDMVEVPAWLAGRGTSSTVDDAVFSVDRLDSLRTRQSAAYKGVSALLMEKGAKDFRTGQEYGLSVFFDESVDIHHIFPKKWCEGADIDAKRYNSIINKTPLSGRTNRMLGGNAPSKYLEKIESGATSAGPISPEIVNHHLETHLIVPDCLRNDDFQTFWDQRKEALIGMVEDAMGKAAFREQEANEPEGDLPDIEPDDSV